MAFNTGSERASIRSRENNRKGSVGFAISKLFSHREALPIFWLEPKDATELTTLCNVHFIPVIFHTGSSNLVPPTA